MSIDPSLLVQWRDAGTDNKAGRIHQEIVPPADALATVSGLLSKRVAWLYVQRRDVKFAGLTHKERDALTAKKTK